MKWLLILLLVSLVALAGTDGSREAHAGSRFDEQSDTEMAESHARAGPRTENIVATIKVITGFLVSASAVAVSENEGSAPRDQTARIGSRDIRLEPILHKLLLVVLWGAAVTMMLLLQ